MIDKIKKINGKYHYFNHISEKPQKGKFIFSVKDSICVKDMPTTAGSKILDNYFPRFDATVVKRLKEAGGVVIGKTSMDAFGFGSFSVNVGLGKKVPRNPFDSERACGGSSGGAAGFTKLWADINTKNNSNNKLKHIALGQSTGGSIACPAAFCGVTGLTPTYGRVSRYGLISYGNSLDKIGPMASSVKECAEALEIISGADGKDSTCLDKKKDFSLTSPKKFRIGVIKESFGKGVDKKVAAQVKSVVKELTKDKKLGLSVKEVSLPLTMKYGIPVYYLLAMTEASTNLAKYCGLRYGQEGTPRGKSFNNYFAQIRSEYFNNETKRRILLGTFARMAGFRDAYYIKAAKIRTLIIKEYQDLFKQFDVLISPSMPIIAPTFDEIEKLTPLQNYMMDILTVGPNLAGLPHLSVPCGFVNKMPIGMLLIGDQWQEKKILQLGNVVEKMATN